jgi:predicted O-methyltransferase YrrM
VLGRVKLRVGPALRSLPVLKASGAGPFDLIFVDADKENNAQYLQWALKLSRRGTVIVVDNVVRHGRVIQARDAKPDIRGTRRCLEMMAAEPRLSAVALQTVGIKGLDGFALAVVLR